ncbi:MAG TPA: hypothetical protein VGM78_11660, partial [Ilumatobacteraceae bacterium]
MAIFVIPVLMSIAVGLVLARAIPLAATRGIAVLRWLLIAAVSTVALVVTDRLARRALPLARLLDLTLIFPDHAPSRFRLAMRTSTTAQLQRTIAEVQEGRSAPDGTPADAAGRLISLVTVLGRHDRLTRGHAERVRAYAQMTATEMG